MTKADVYYASVKADREAWKASMPPFCMKCKLHVFLTPRKFLEIHEILPRSQLPNAWHFRANLLALCSVCHSSFQARNRESMIYQLFLKRENDRAHYNLYEWLYKRNPRAMEFITEAEVECIQIQ